MYKYFTVHQLREFGRALLASGRTDFDHDEYHEFLNDWEANNPHLFEPTLPPIFSMEEPVHLVINGQWTKAEIHAIHILPRGAKYDLVLFLPNNEKQRIYNVSAALIARPEWVHPHRDLENKIAEEAEQAALEKMRTVNMDEWTPEEHQLFDQMESAANTAAKGIADLLTNQKDNVSIPADQTESPSISQQLREIWGIDKK